jgi:hypothetical protein
MALAVRSSRRAFAFLVDISPDEKWAALWNFDTRGDGTWLVPLTGGASHRLCPCGMGPIFPDSPRVSWSGDGKTMFATLPDSRTAGGSKTTW